MTPGDGPAQVILLVSPEASRRASLRWLFEGRLLGVQVAETSRTAEAVEVLRVQPVTVVLADHTADLDAVGVLAEARRRAPRARRVLVAEQVDLSLLVRALDEARIHGLLPRPVAPHDALRVLGRLLSEAREEAVRDGLLREAAQARRDAPPSATTGEAA